MAIADVAGTSVITLSEAAANKLLAIMEEKGVRGSHALRVFISGGGCNGLQYGMGFDAASHPQDTVFEQHGLRVVIDPRSLPYIVGAIIDYVDDPINGGFQIDNPNAVSACGGGCSGCR